MRKMEQVTGWALTGFVVALAVSIGAFSADTDPTPGRSKADLMGAGSPLHPVDPQAVAQRDALWQKVQGLVGDAACQDSSQCRAIAYGHKACGGPAGYLVYSTMHTDEAALKSAVEQYTRAARAAERPGMVSTCEMLLEPAVACQAKRCVRAPGKPGDNTAL